MRELNRRMLLTSTGAFLGINTIACSEYKNTHHPIGIQLYTLRDLYSQDPHGLLQTLAEIGYKEIEFFEYGEESPQSLRDTLDRYALVAPATHASLSALRGGLDSVISSAKVLGCSHVVLPWIPLSERPSLSEWRRRFSEMSIFGERLADEGLQFAFHPHDIEFSTIDGAAPFDVLMEETDPSLVKIEIDFYWFAKGRRDPVRLFREYPGRFPLAHMKDISADGIQKDVGDGVLDFSNYLQHMELAGLKHLFVERDDAPAPYLPSVERSFSALTKILAS